MFQVEQPLIDRLRRRAGIYAQFAIQSSTAEVVDAQRRRPIPQGSVQLHEARIGGLLQRVVLEQALRMFNRGAIVALFSQQVDQRIDGIKIILLPLLT